MTCIVGFVQHDGTIWMGGDSAGVGGYSLTQRKDPKVFINGEFIIGYTSSFRMGHLLHWAFEPPKHPVDMEIDRYMNTLFIDAVRKCFKDGGYLEKKNEGERGGCFLVGYRGRLFEIEEDFQVGESIHPYAAVGCGWHLALGAMHALNCTGTKPDGMIRMALEAAETFSSGVRRPFLILSHPDTDPAKRKHKR